MAGTIEARFRKHKAFCEQIGHRSFVIVPHEIRVKIPFEQRNNNNYDAHTHIQKIRRNIYYEKISYEIQGKHAARRHRQHPRRHGWLLLLRQPLARHVHRHPHVRPLHLPSIPSAGRLPRTA